MSTPTLDPVTRRVQSVLVSNAAEVYGAPTYSGPVCVRCGFQDPSVDPRCQGECEKDGAR